MNLWKAIELVGSQAELARRLEVTPQAITQWLNGSKRIPPLRAAQIHGICNGAVAAWDLLPEFPWPRAA